MLFSKGRKYFRLFHQCDELYDQEPDGCGFVYARLTEEKIFL